MLLGRSRGGLGQVTVLLPLHREGSLVVTQTRGSRLIWLALSQRTLFSGPSDTFLDRYLVEFRNRVVYLARLIPERSPSSWHFLHVVVALQPCVTEPLLVQRKWWGAVY
jgi:hypothetical protein